MERVRDHIFGFLEEWWKPFGILLVSATLVFVIASSNAKTAARLEQVATETHTALCTFKADLERRYESTVKYLHRHEGPEPIPGITRGTLRRSLQSQKATLDALDVLDCTI